MIVNLENLNMCLSHYISDRQPKRFDGNHDLFVKYTKTVTEHVVNMIKEDKNKDLTNLFFTIIDYLKNQRAKLAEEQQTKNGCGHFGKMRKESDSYNLNTRLVGIYETYGEKMVEFFHKYLDPKKSKYSVDTETFFNRKFRLDFEIINKNNEDQHLPPCKTEEAKDIFQICSIPWPLKTDPLVLVNFSNDLKKVELLKKRTQNEKDDSKKYYIRMRNEPIALLKYEHKISDCDWVKLTMRIEIDNKMYALSQYFTHIKCNSNLDIKERIPKNSIVILSHQDVFIVDEMLKEISKIFKTAIEWDKKNLNTLKKRVALIQYMLAQATPFLRGSAAISDWLERAIYLYHDYCVISNDENMVNLEALTSTFSEFAKEYISGKMIFLKKINHFK